MAQELRCPACRSLLDMSSTSCQICLRPVSRQEIVRALQKGKKEEKRRRQWVFGLVLIAAGAAGMILRPDWRAAVLGAAKPIMAPVAKTAKAQVDSTIKKNWPGAETASDVVTPQQAMDHAVAGADSVSGSTAAAAAPPPAAAPAKAASLEPAEPVSWTIAGLVYFMRDAKPASGIQLSFTPTDGGPIKTARTGKDGRYTVKVPILQGGAGYRIALLRAGRELAFLEEAALPYRARTAAQREDAIEESRQSPVLHAPLTPEGADTTQDFALLP